MTWFSVGYPHSPNFPAAYNHKTLLWKWGIFKDYSGYQTPDTEGKLANTEGKFIIIHFDIDMKLWSILTK